MSKAYGLYSVRDRRTGLMVRFGTIQEALDFLAEQNGGTVWK